MIRSVSKPISLLPPGSRFADFEVLRPVRVGATGWVYEARPSSRERRVALEVLTGRARLAPEVWDRRRAQRRPLSALWHPGVVRVCDAGCHDDLEYIAYEWAEGTTLAARLEERGPFPLDRALALARHLAAALDHLHMRQVVHRLLEPAHVLVTANGSPRLLELGLEWSRETAAAGARGRWARSPYRAPELAAGGGASREADVYALGAILYEVLTGRTPEETPSVCALRPGLPGEVDQLVRGMLAPRKRLTAREARREVERLMRRRTTRKAPVAAGRAPARVERTAPEVRIAPAGSGARLTTRGTRRVRALGLIMLLIAALALAVPSAAAQSTGQAVRVADMMSLHGGATGWDPSIAARSRSCCSGRACSPAGAGSRAAVPHRPLN
jgi:serine/threonine protein kinase